MAGWSKPKRHHNPEFLRMRREGIGRKDIAAAFDVSVKAVDGWVSAAIKEGLISGVRGTTPTPAEIEHYRRRAAENWSIGEIAKEAGLERTVVSGRMSRAGITTTRNKAWPDEQKAEIVKLWREGMSAEDIAPIVGRGVPAVRRMATSLGLKRPPKPPRAPRPPRKFKGKPAVVFGNIKGRQPYTPINPAAWELTPKCRPWLERERGECVWPLGERGDIHSCCAPVRDGDNYCSEHRLMAGGLKSEMHPRARNENRRGPATVFDRGMAA